MLSFAKIYTTTCTYCWMFCEGFYLHQLITNTFEPPKSLTRLYLFGWRESCCCRGIFQSFDIAFLAVRIKKNTFSGDNIRFSPEHCKHCTSVTGDGMFAVAAVVEHTTSFVRPLTHTPGTDSRNRRHKFDARFRRQFFVPMHDF